MRQTLTLGKALQTSSFHLTINIKWTARDRAHFQQLTLFSNFSLLKVSFEVFLRNIPLLAARHDNKQQTGPGQACQPHFLNISKQRHKLCLAGFALTLGMIPVWRLHHTLHKHACEAASLTHQVLFDKKGLLRASGPANYWRCHTQAQTGRGVCLGVNMTIQRTSLLRTCRAGEFCHIHCWPRLTTTAMTNLFVQPRKNLYGGTHGLLHSS